ncbi:PqqD family protein [Janibacter anophelis]|uniref:PqqD family protein n=1 Tax=Janibacter anophelis TaxID=319054 RepID=UPI000DEF80D5|nr:PqqD family protein [Janibacter anophelis]
MTTYVAAPGVAWTLDTDEWDLPRVFVAPLPHGPISVLPVESALIWLAAVEGVRDVVAEVARLAGEPVETVRGDVEAVLGQLVAQGLLARR